MNDVSQVEMSTLGGEVAYTYSSNKVQQAVGKWLKELDGRKVTDDSCRGWRVSEAAVLEHHVYESGSCLCGIFQL